MFLSISPTATDLSSIAISALGMAMLLAMYGMPAALGMAMLLAMYGMPAAAG